MWKINFFLTIPPLCLSDPPSLFGDSHPQHLVCSHFFSPAHSLLSISAHSPHEIATPWKPMIKGASERMKNRNHPLANLMSVVFKK